MPKVSANGINIYYERHGQGEPLVLIAGFSADHSIWETVIEPLSKHYEVIVFDNRGAGQTDVPAGPYNIEELAEDVVGLCQALDIQQAHFIGNSMGGFILQTLARHHTNLVKSAVISNSTNVMHTCFQYFVESQLEMIKADAPFSALIKAAFSWAFSFRFLSQPGVFEQLIQSMLDNPYPCTPEGYEAQSQALSQFDSRGWLDELRVPVLVIGGDQDLIFHESTIKALAEGIPKAQYYCFQECGHLPHIEYPEQFVKVVRDFLTA
ncbi:MAG: alpha/beta fold hydrolase [Gammaproteobacteria bacterium]